MKPEFHKKKLRNGLTVLFEKRRQPVVSVSANVREGFAFETEKKKGISHFTEHFVFKGTETRSYKELAEEIEKKGGILNAYTDEEVTSFWTKLPAKYFSVGREIISDLTLNPRFDEKEFEKEKGVILEEVKMHRDNPQIYVLDKIKSLLYKKPFGISGIGTNNSILNLTRQDILDFFKNNYASNRMFLCVVGNTDIEEIENFAKRFPETVSRGRLATAEKINQQLVEKRKALEQSNFVLGFHASSLQERRRYACEIFNAILTGGMSSKLFEEIRDKRGLAYDVRGFLDLGRNFGYQVIYIGTKKENVKRCKEIILKEIKKMQKLEKKDFEEAKEQLIGLRKVGSEESLNVMNALIREEVAGNAEEFYNYEDRVNSVKLQQVRKLSKLKGYSSIALVPE